MKFKNPSNDHIEKISSPGLWTFLFGSFYFAFKGVWSHALISFILALVTVGISWLIYPFFASSIMRKHYLNKGWSEITG